jgi:hypothetical protein
MRAYDTRPLVGRAGAKREVARATLLDAQKGAMPRGLVGLVEVQIKPQYSQVTTSLALLNLRRTASVDPSMAVVTGTLKVFTVKAMVSAKKNRNATLIIIIFTAARQMATPLVTQCMMQCRVFRTAGCTAARRDPAC